MIDTVKRVAEKAGFVFNNRASETAKSEGERIELNYEYGDAMVTIIYTNGEEHVYIDVQSKYEGCFDCVPIPVHNFLAEPFGTVGFALGIAVIEQRATEKRYENDRGY